MSDKLISIHDLAEAQLCVDRRKFINLTMIFLELTEKNSKERLNLDQICKIGFSRDEIMPYVLILVQIGILEKQVRIYDFEDDCFVDFNGQCDLRDLPESQVQVWFRPNLNK